MVWKTINGNSVDIDISNSAKVDPTRRQTSNLPSNKQNHQMPSILARLKENRIATQARKDQKADEDLKEKKLKQNLTIEYRLWEKNMKTLANEFKKGRIDSGEYQKKLNKLTPTNKTEKQILPSGKINLTDDGIKLKNSYEKSLRENTN